MNWPERREKDRRPPHKEEKRVVRSYREVVHVQRAIPEDRPPSRWYAHCGDRFGTGDTIEEAVDAVTMLGER